MREWSQGTGKTRLVYIVAADPKPYAKMFLERSGNQFRGTKDIQKADIILFTGGPDVDPQLYGERMLTSTFIQPTRDQMDIAAWGASDPRQVLVGICRGAQFLNVMCGGKLWQDVDNHRTPHHIVERMTGARIWATSTHHQMMIPGDGARIIATTAVANSKISYGKEWKRVTPHFHPNVVKFDDDRADVEVLAYDSKNVLCFQPHPEHSGAAISLKNFFFNQLEVMIKRSEMK